MTRDQFLNYYARFDWWRNVLPVTQAAAFDFLLLNPDLKHDRREQDVAVFYFVIGHSFALLPEERLPIVFSLN